MKVNSVEYWNRRFETDWNEFGGDNQTIFFANTLCNMLPQWFVDELRQNKYTVCDLGCADGDALPIWNDIFKGCSIYGEDFAESAIKNARKKYPEFMYLVSDIMQPQGNRQYDVIISSNTVEHFNNTKDVLKNICARSNKYTLIMIPYREDADLTEEHEVKFHTNKIPQCVGDDMLIYAKSCQCNSSYYPGEQILLIYSKDSKDTMLSDIVEHVNSDAYKALEITNEALSQKCVELENSNTMISQANADLAEIRTMLENEKTKLESEKTAWENRELIFNNDIDMLRRKQEILEKEINSIKLKNDELEAANKTLRYSLEESEIRLENSENKRIVLENRINAAVAKCNDLTNWGLYKFSHMLHRTKHQFFNSSREERRKYIRWIFGYLKGNGTDADRRFKPIYQIADILREHEKKIDFSLEASQLGDYLNDEKERLKNDEVNYDEISRINEILKKGEYKGVIVCPYVECKKQYHVNQQILGAFAKLGWACFFCENPDVRDINTIMEQGSIISVHEKEFLHAIVDQEVIVLLTWIGSYAFLDELKNKKIWYHLSEKIEDLPYYGEAYQKIHDKVVAGADLVSFSECSFADGTIDRKDAIYLQNDSSNDAVLLEDIKRIENRFNREIDIILGQAYQKADIIILSVIDYDFRFQRPQQIAVRYAQNGHRVFYINANFYNDYSITEYQKNLYVANIHNDTHSAIYSTDWTTQKAELSAQIKRILDSYCIRDAMTIVDYPNWVYLAELIRKEYGFKIITDYMDDYTGFLNPAELLVKKNCENLLRTSDLVISSSQFLYNIAQNYNTNLELIRNGTEFSHFNTAIGKIEKQRKTIGYYGAVAEWFQSEKVEYIAANLPECDIVIIGDITNKVNNFSKYRNIKLLGEKPYNELPKFLRDFDVCIIPFDTSTDLIKATNPVKFYEYLSAGKKIVSTEIPELEAYRDQYVYMANENEKFLKYVRMCLEGKDTLESPEKCADFAKSHDWQARYDAFYKASLQVVPKISIIVLTFNNLKINKLCINSILEKTAYPNYELIIVDNNSADGTREYLLELSKIESNVKVILNKDNIGFAAGNNMGIKEADGEYVVLLNNDTIVTRGWLTALSKHMENNNMIGMCGPVTNSIGNEAEIEVTYHNMRELERFSYDYTTSHLMEEYGKVNVLALFCTMIKRQVLNDCGYLDEHYGVGMFEDDDYAEAVKEKGYTIIVAEDAFIHHFGSVSFNKLEDEAYHKIFTENKSRFEEKWGIKWKAHKYREGVNARTNIDCTILQSD